MANRFVKKSRDFFIIKDVLAPVALFIAFIALFNFGLRRLNTTTKEDQLESVQQAVTNATVQCYALEGRYPPDIGYLEEHYGLRVDLNEYIVHYEAFATNIMPDILVLPKEF